MQNTNFKISTIDSRFGFIHKLKIKRINFPDKCEGHDTKQQTNIDSKLATDQVCTPLERC